MARGTARAVTQFTESVIRGMSQQAERYGAVNLAQGFPDFPAPDLLKEAARAAIADDFNQYAVTWGAPVLRRAIAEKAGRYNGIVCDPDRNVTVTCGSTEAMMAVMLAIVEPGDEIILFEPFYENYGPDVIVSGARPVIVPLREGFRFDPEELRRAFSTRTKAIVVNTPHNPTGSVFTREELTEVATLCQELDCYCITDEIYEHILYDGRQHVSPASIPGLDDRTITISGMSKTYSVTGWRVAWVIAPDEVTDAVRRIHDFLTVGAPHPLQIASAAALAAPPAYYEDLVASYTRRRDRLVAGLRAAGFPCTAPEGAYYVMTDIRGFGRGDDVAFCEWLVREVGVAAVPGSSFYRPGETAGSRQVRFTFSKTEETLERAIERICSI